MPIALVGQLDWTQSPLWSPVEQNQQELRDPKSLWPSGGWDVGGAVHDRLVSWQEPLALLRSQDFFLLQGGPAGNVYPILQHDLRWNFWKYPKLEVIQLESQQAVSTTRPLCSSGSSCNEMGNIFLSPYRNVGGKILYVASYIYHFQHSLSIYYVVDTKLSLMEQTKRKNTMAAPRSQLKEEEELFIYIQQSFIKHLLNARHEKRLNELLIRPIIQEKRWANMQITYALLVVQHGWNKWILGTKLGFEWRSGKLPQCEFLIGPWAARPGRKALYLEKSKYAWSQSEANRKEGKECHAKNKIGKIHHSTREPQKVVKDVTTILGFKNNDWCPSTAPPSFHCLYKTRVRINQKYPQKHNDW